MFSLDGCNNVSTSPCPSRIMPLLTQGWSLIPTPLNLGGFHCNQESGGSDAEWFSPSDFHCGVRGNAASASFSSSLMEPWATRKQLPAPKPPCCEEAPARANGEIPRPSSETKPRAAWPATSCCVHTHSPPCPLAPASVWREPPERPEPETPSRALFIETMKRDEMSAVVIKSLYLRAICYTAVDHHKPHCPFPHPCRDSPEKRHCFYHAGWEKAVERNGPGWPGWHLEDGQLADICSQFLVGRSACGRRENLKVKLAFPSRWGSTCFIWMAFSCMQVQNSSVVPRTSTIGVMLELSPSASPINQSTLKKLPSHSCMHIHFRSNELEPCSSRYFLPYYFSSCVPLVAKDVTSNVYNGDVFKIQFSFLSFKQIQGNLLEKSMAIHSSILAWRIPWTEEPGGLQSMGSQLKWLSTAQHREIYIN